jgi:hypothetical protein
MNYKNVVNYPFPLLETNLIIRLLHIQLNFLPLFNILDAVNYYYCEETDGFSVLNLKQTCLFQWLIPNALITSKISTSITYFFMLHMGNITSAYESENKHQNNFIFIHFNAFCHMIKKESQILTLPKLL